VRLQSSEQPGLFRRPAGLWSQQVLALPWTSVSARRLLAKPVQLLQDDRRWRP